MQLQLPPYHREPDPKTVHEPHQYPQDPSHPVQLIQLGAAPPYCYQDPHEQYRHLYPQGLLQQHDQQKQYTSEGRAPSLNSHVGLTPPGTAEDPARSEVNSVGNNVPHRTLLPPSGAHLNNKSSQQDSPGPGWPQVGDILHPCSNLFSGKAARYGNEMLWLSRVKMRQDMSSGHCWDVLGNCVNRVLHRCFGFGPAGQ